MKKITIFGIILLVIGSTQLACGIFTPKSTETPIPPTAMPTATATEVIPTDTPTDEPTAAAQNIPPTQTGSHTGCSISVDNEVTVYMRPSEESLVFGFLPTGLVGEASGRTEDGWLGFIPDLMQAGNVGVFRLRWVPPDAQVELSGDCDNLPIIWGPPPGICFAMFMTEANIYQSPSVTSPVITTVGNDDTAEVLGKLGDNWVKLDLSVGNMDLQGEGWVERTKIGFTGPCKDLPMLAP
jgi:hypothetical protein